MEKQSMTEQNRIDFTPLRVEHFPLLCAWLQQPHVHSFYDTGTTWVLDLIIQKFGPYVDGYKLDRGVRKPIHAKIILDNGIPVGYIQYYHAHAFPRDGYDLAKVLGFSDIEGGELAALDLFIGDPCKVGQGLGPLILQRLLEQYVWKEFAACLVDPDPLNRQAIRAFEKAGFQRMFSDPPLMICHKTAARPVFVRTGVYGVALREDEILVVQQQKGVHIGKWDLPGGGIDPGESIEEALRREFLEEVGATYGKVQHFANLTAVTDHPHHPMRLQQVGLIYHVEDLVFLGGTTELEAHWKSKKELQLLQVTPFLKEALALI